MTAEDINKKTDIAWKAVSIYEEKGDVSIPELLDAAGLTASELYQYFPNKKSILEYYYEALVFQYWAMIEEIEDFEGYSLSEKLSNFIYTLFDMLNEHPRFVQDTFEKRVLGKGSNSGFRREVSEVFRHFFTTDGNIAVSAAFFMKDLFYSFLSYQYLYVVKFWLQDDSEGRERSLALTDKFTTFIQEVCYNKVVDKGFDLVKYLFGSAKIAEDIPVFGDWISDFFTDKNPEEEPETEIEVEAEAEDE